MNTYRIRKDKEDIYGDLYQIAYTSKKKAKINFNRIRILAHLVDSSYVEERKTNLELEAISTQYPFINLHYLNPKSKNPKATIKGITLLDNEGKEKFMLIYKLTTSTYSGWTFNIDEYKIVKEPISIENITYKELYYEKSE